jgi:glycyl-tRNA synthetase
MFWNQYGVALRDEIQDKIVEGLQDAMWDFYGKEFIGNPGELWKWNKIEAPILTPDEVVSAQYSRDRMYGTRDDLVLRPQTTPGSFQYASLKIKKEYPFSYSDFGFSPFVVWQHGKSFRREQTKTRKHQRLKEFYQLEIELFDVPCRFTNKAEVMKLIQAVKKSIQSFVGRCKVVDAKAPSYAEWTKDIILSKTGMELASISLRKDFPVRYRADVRDPSAGQEIVVLEFAIGTDRVVMNTKKTVMRRVVDGKWRKEKSQEEERKRRRRKERDASK